MDTLHLIEKIRMTKLIFIIIGMVVLITFAYFGRMDGYIGRIEMFSIYDNKEG